jgi:hypothetical protein
MRIDFTNPFNEGLVNLNNWRNRYLKQEYPVKVVLNIFYRQYTMNSIGDSQINSSFSKLGNADTDLMQAFQKLESEYSNASGQFTIGNTLIDLMNQKQDVGEVNSKNYLPLISESESGDNKAIEELDFTNLHFLLCNKAGLIWAAYARKGFSHIDATAQVTGVRIEFNKTITYSDILLIFGQLSVSKLMDNIYSTFCYYHN